MSRRATTRAGERGAAIVLLVLSIVALLTIAALVLDVGFAYASGRRNQNVADMSALAAARHLPGDPVTACTAGWSYLRANLHDLPSGASMPCGTFPTSCTDSTTNPDVTATPGTPYPATGAGPYTITFVYPVVDTDPLLTGPTPRSSDGDACQRFGVIVNEHDPVFFNGIAGLGGFNPHVAAVARYWAGGGPHGVANLISLDPIGCTGMEVNGPSNTNSTTEIDVSTETWPTPGAVAIDSDGSACSGGSTTIDANGQALLHVHPVAGPPAQISLYALPGSQLTCVVPACNGAQVPTQSTKIEPYPVSSTARVTRAPADTAYNCKPDYPLYDGPSANFAGIPISCDYSSAKHGGPYIDELISTVTGYNPTANPAVLPTGYTLLPQCKFNSSPATPFVGNFWAECPSGQGLSVGAGAKVVFQGNVIVDGNINVAGGGELDFGGGSAASIDPACQTTVNDTCLGESDTNYSLLYVNGSITPSSTFTMQFNHTFVYMTAASGSTWSAQTPANFACAVQSGANSLTSNSSGAESWIAPTEGPFRHLALWSESGSGNSGSGGSTTSNFALNGGGNTTVSGVFFTPCAQFNISGGFTNPQTAQFLTFRLAVSGGSQLTMLPDPTQMLQTAPSGSELIR